MSGFELSYSDLYGYLIRRGLLGIEINKNQLDTDKTMGNCKFDVEFRII